MDIFVELFEGTAAERSIHRILARRKRVPGHEADGRDFRSEVARWLDLVLISPTPSKARQRKFKRLREDPFT